MDAVTLIVTALAAGVASGNDEASSEVQGAYRCLKVLARGRFAGHPYGQLVLSRHEAHPETWETQLAKELSAAGAANDCDLVASAQVLMSLVDEAGSQAKRYVVGVRGPQDAQVHDRQSLVTLLSLGFSLTALGLMVSGGVALWLGFRDLFLPVSISSELLGLAFFLAGLVGLAALAGIIIVERTLWSRRKMPAHVPVTRHSFLIWLDKIATPKWSAVLVLAGAVAGLYADLTIVLSSFRYRAVIVSIFGVLAFLCFCSVWVTLAAVWKAPGKVSNRLKGLGVSVLVGLVAQFWYLAIYIPGSTQVGVQYTLTVGPVIQSGSDKLVTLQFTMENESSVTGLALASMIVVNGIEFPSPGKPSGAATRSDLATQQQMIKYAEQQQQEEPFNNPDVRFAGNETPIVLAIQKPIDVGAYLFEDEAYSKDLVVVIPPEPNPIEALQVRILVDYAQTARMVLGRAFSAKNLGPKNCQDAVLANASYIQESALQSFAMGKLALYSYWCANLNDPSIGEEIAGPPLPNSSVRFPAPSVEKAFKSNYGYYSSSRDEIFVLSSALVKPLRFIILLGNASRVQVT
jgi:hypothetical protein